MKKILPFLLIQWITYSCNNSSPVNASTIDSSTNNAQQASLSSASAPAHPSDSAKKVGDNTEDEVEPPPSEIYNDCIKSYTTSFDLDTFLLMGRDTFEINLHHYCTFDSAINLPARYLEPYKLKNFITHDFATKIQITKNDRNILTKLITTKDFAPLLFDTLGKYATLSEPGFRLVKDTFKIYYSISIPLTDVGIAAEMLIAQNGKIRVRNN